jgi:hypothetical protein
MKKRRVLILDCTAKEEPREGKLIQSLLRICKLHKPAMSASLYYTVKSAEELISKLKTKTKYDIIHISAHGSPKGIGDGKTWEVKTEEIIEARTPFRKAKLVHLSACVSSYKEMADAFNSKYFIAPKTEVDWINAAVFSVLFYKRYIVDGVLIHNAFEYARKRTQTCVDYPVLWYE